MKRTLTITIDANRVTCGKCEHLAMTDNGDVLCSVFRRSITQEDDGDLRCAPCLAAEVRE